MIPTAQATCWLWNLVLFSPRLYGDVHPTPPPAWQDETFMKTSQGFPMSLMGISFKKSVNLATKSTNTYPFIMVRERYSMSNSLSSMA